MKARWLLCLFVVACGDNGGVDQTLVLSPLHLSTAEDHSVSATVSVTGGDDKLELSATPPSHGTVTISGLTVTYTPDANFNGTDTLTVKATDGLLAAQATVDIAISAVNDPPTPVDDSFAGTEGIPVVITSTMLLANDTDVDGDPLSVTGAENATHGTVMFADGSVTFTPDAGFHDVATFDYDVSDGTDTATGHVSITFGPNQPPVAVDDSFTTLEDTASVVTQAMLIQNDTDADNNTLSVQSVSNGSHGGVVMTGNNITFTPDANFNGDGGYDYVVFDGTDTDTGHVTIHVTAVNDAPVAVDDVGTTDEDTTLSIPVATLVANDTDVDGDTLTISAVSNATHGTATLNGANVDFVPAANFNGTAGYDYTVTDGHLSDTGHVTITVNPVNDAPVAVDDTATTKQDIPVDIPVATLLANDTDVDGDTLSITDVGNAVNGTVVLATGIVTFTPAPGFTGAASFDYTVSDGSLTDTGTVAVTVTVPSTCGNGIIEGTETCDDNNTADGDGCSSTCQTEHGFQCTGAPSVCTSDCGDGIVASNEQCDDGNATAGDGCTACTIDTGFTCGGEPSVCSAVCGDGVLEGAETCDDGNTTNGDGCNAGCQVEHGFTCIGTPSVCTSTCGDGIVASNEACDDHNNTSGDGCSAACTVEPNFTCTGEPSVCTATSVCGNGIVETGEQCDDHNTTSGDGCSSTCQFENVCLFTFTGAAGDEPTINADSSEAGVALPAMTRGAGVTASKATGTFSGSSWNTAALDPTAFYSFTLTPDAGVTMNLQTFIFGDQRSGTGPVTWSLRSSLDAFAADIATSATHPAPLTANTIALPAGQFLGLAAPIEFRIFGFGASAAAGTWRIDNVEVVGFTQGP